MTKTPNPRWQDGGHLNRLSQRIQVCGPYAYDKIVKSQNLGFRQLAITFEPLEPETSRFWDQWI